MSPSLEEPTTQCSVVLYSKPGCHLCDKVKAQLQKLQKVHAFEWREVNILESPEALDTFREEIPVIFINGRQAFKYYLDEKEFLKRLQH